MESIQTDVSDEALITAIRANMCDFFRHLSRGNPAEHFENEHFTRWYSPAPHPWFNGVLSSKPYKADDDSFIEETIQYFRDKGTFAFTWWMEPYLKPTDWEPALSSHGFHFSNDTPGMAIDLHEMNNSTQTPDGFEIRVVAEETALHTLANVFVHGYGLPSQFESRVFDFWKQIGLDLPIRNYLGYWKGEPVSTSTLFCSGGAAGIYCVATVPKARGKGMGAALTLRPLHDAREMGYRVGVLQSSEMGFNVYKRLGFRHLCQIENFYLSVK